MRPRRGRDETRQEFERFVESAAPGLLRTAAVITWDVTAAEDLVQECLFQVARRWPRVRAMDHPAAYARRILVNLAIGDAPKRERSRSELDRQQVAGGREPADRAAEASLASVESSPELLAALGSLAPLQRAVLGLRYLDDLSTAQVAELLGCSVGTVKSTSARALARLRDTLAPTTVRAEHLTTDGLEATEGI